MEKFLKYAIAILFLLTLASGTAAKGVVKKFANPAEVRNWEIKLNDIRNKVSSEIGEEQSSRLDQRILDIEVLPDLQIIHGLPVASILELDGRTRRKITFSAGSINMLRLYIMAELIAQERYEGDPNFAKYFVRDVFASFAGNSEAENNVFDFAAMDQGDIEEFSQKHSETVERMLDFSIIHVMTHELGHHALNAFYVSDASNFAKRQVEQRVDEWAIQVQAKLGIPSIMSAHAPLMFNYYTELYSFIYRGNKPGGSHPLAFKRLEDNYKSSCRKKSQTVENAIRIVGEDRAEDILQRITSLCLSLNKTIEFNRSFGKYDFDGIWNIILKMERDAALDGESGRGLSLGEALDLGEHHFLLYRMRNIGFHVRRHAAKAFIGARDACKYGYADACLIAGEYFVRGDTFGRDLNKAGLFYGRAKELGHIAAPIYLDELDRYGIELERLP